jgi:hypothetical protein
MTFFGGRRADGGFETCGNGVDICARRESLLLFRDLRRLFMMIGRERGREEEARWKRVRDLVESNKRFRGAALLSLCLSLRY